MTDTKRYHTGSAVSKVAAVMLVFVMPYWSIADIIARPPPAPAATFRDILLTHWRTQSVGAWVMVTRDDTITRTTANVIVRF